jgi:Protein of unknown function (DUF4230)
MGVITPERERVEPAQPPPSPPEPPPRRDIPWGLIAVGIVVALLATGVVSFRDLLPSFDNPFRAETVDRSGPAVLRSIEDIGEYRAASGHFEVVIDLEKDTALPSDLLGSRTLFIAYGTVDATVDFSTIGNGAVEVSDDRLHATITLPPPRLSEARIDPTRSYVYDHEEGVVNEISGLFSSDDNSQQELYVVAQERITASAQQGSGLIARAQENTRAMLVSMLTALGFETVVVNYEPS